MPRSLILRTVSLGLLYIIILFSFYVFLQGHNAPGGGFIAGLVAAAVILIQYMAFSREDFEKTFRPMFHRLLGLGILFAALSGLIGVWEGTAFLDGFHWVWDLPGGGHVEFPTVALFDLGVYFVVIGTVVGIFLALEEQQDRGTQDT